MKRFSIFMAMLACMLTVIGAKHEMRGVWIATVWGIDWPSRAGNDAATIAKQKEQLSAMLDRCKQLNLTTVIFQVRSMSDAVYRSSMEPSSRFVTGKRGEPLKWDPLEWMVEECHDRGLECYAWVNPFRAPAAKDAVTPFDRTCRDRGWVLEYDKYSVLNPGIPQVRAHVTDVCREIVTLYDVDGLIFDDYFYPNRIPADASAPDYQLYLDSGTEMSIAEWRRTNVHKLVADIHAMIFDRCPDVRFGISPAGVAGKHDTSARKWGLTGVNIKAADWQWNEIFSDPVGWLYEGTVDFVSPQLYWPTTHATAPFEPLAQWWDYAAGRHGRHSFPSITLADLEKSTSHELIDDHMQQLELTRNLSTPGIIIYSARFLDRIASPLSSCYFTNKALSPSAPWKYPHNYEAPEGLKRKGNKLTWHDTEPDTESAIVRYSVYAYPSNLKLDDVSDTDGEQGIDGKYLLGITYSPEFIIPDHALRGMNFAVAVLDGNSVEHPYSILHEK